jgi:hypothetical protein
MLFHVFASNKDANFKTKVKYDLATDPTDYNSTLEDYRKAKESYSHVYFIADMGIYTENFLEYVSIGDNAMILPFLIILEYHIDKMNVLELRNDSIKIKQDGIDEVFNSNKAAIEKFLYYLNSSIDAYMCFGENDSKYIASVKHILMNIKNKSIHKIKRFNFDLY